MRAEDIARIISQQDNEILQREFEKLSYVNGVAVYWDSTATKRRIETYTRNTKHIPQDIIEKAEYGIEENVSLVTKEGKFLIGSIYENFYNQIDINEYGLFLLQPKYFYGKISKIDSYVRYFCDYKGNYLSRTNYEQVLKILSNTNCGFGRSEFIQKLYKEIEDAAERMWNSSAKFVYDDAYDLEFDVLRPDGLRFIKIETTRSGSDSYQTWDYVIDKEYNKMGLREFNVGLAMLVHGQNYLKALGDLYLKNCLSPS